MCDYPDTQSNKQDSCQNRKGVKLFYVKDEDC